MITDLELEQINPLTEKIIGCAIEVHRGLGPGLLEHTYEAARGLRVGLLNQFQRSRVAKRRSEIPT